SIDIGITLFDTFSTERESEQGNVTGFARQCKSIQKDVFRGFGGAHYHGRGRGRDRSPMAPKTWRKQPTGSLRKSHRPTGSRDRAAQSALVRTQYRADAEGCPVPSTPPRTSM